jgi:hypothetical protein
MIPYGGSWFLNSAEIPWIGTKIAFPSESFRVLGDGAYACHRHVTMGTSYEDFYFLFFIFILF